MELAEMTKSTALIGEKTLTLSLPGNNLTFLLEMERKEHLTSESGD